MTSEEDTVALIVLEQGAEWPSWGAELRSRASNALVEARLPEESIPEFEQRIGHRLSQCREQGVDIVAVGYVCALRGVNDKRARLTRALVHALAERPDAELVIGGGAWANQGAEGQERDLLMQLWGELSGEAPGRLVSVRFEQRPAARGQSSGVFSTASGRLEPTSPVEAERDSAAANS